MRRAAAVVLVSLLARAGAPPVEGETPEEAEARKARERKEVEVDMLAMHHWRGPAASRRAAAGADLSPRAGSATSRRTRTCTSATPSATTSPGRRSRRWRRSDRTRTRRASRSAPCTRAARAPRARRDAPPRRAARAQETYCAIEDNVQRQPCRFFKPRRKRDL